MVNLRFVGYFAALMLFLLYIPRERKLLVLAILGLLILSWQTFLQLIYTYETRSTRRLEELLRVEIIGVERGNFSAKVCNEADKRLVKYSFWVSGFAEGSLRGEKLDEIRVGDAPDTGFQSGGIGPKSCKTETWPGSYKEFHRYAVTQRSGAWED